MPRKAKVKEIINKLRSSIFLIDFALDYTIIKVK